MSPISLDLAVRLAAFRFLDEKTRVFATTTAVLSAGALRATLRGRNSTAGSRLHVGQK